MGISANLTEINNNTIANALPATVMRRSMENKNLLANKGSIYIGTGTTVPTSVTIGGVPTIYETAKTAALPVGSNKQVLIADSNAVEGVKWGDICLYHRASFTGSAWSDEISDRSKYKRIIEFDNNNSLYVVTNILLLKDVGGNVFQHTQCDFDLSIISGKIRLTLYSEEQFAGLVTITKMLFNQV